MTTATDTLIASTVEKIRYALGEGCTLLTADEGTHAWSRVHHAHDELRFWLGQCLTRGITLRQLAQRAGISGQVLLPFVEHPRHRADSYAAEIHHLERSLEQVRGDRVRLAVEEYRMGLELSPADRRAAGLQKTDIAERWGVSRVTLDAWIAAG